MEIVHKKIQISIVFLDELDHIQNLKIRYFEKSGIYPQYPQNITLIKVAAHTYKNSLNSNFLPTPRVEH